MLVISILTLVGLTVFQQPNFDRIDATLRRLSWGSPLYVPKCCETGFSHTISLALRFKGGSRFWHQMSRYALCHDVRVTPSMKTGLPTCDWSLLHLTLKENPVSNSLHRSEFEPVVSAKTKRKRHRDRMEYQQQPCSRVVSAQTEVNPAQRYVGGTGSPQILSPSTYYARGRN